MRGSRKNFEVKELTEKLQETEEKLQETEEQLNFALDMIEVLKARISKLEEQLRMSSDNSSKPPSSDPPWQKKKKKRVRGRGKKGKRGAQVGHEGKARALLPEKEVDHFVDCKPPSHCTCGGGIVLDANSPERQQKFELPKVAPEVTEFKIYSGVCCCCGQHHRGHVPEGVPSGMLMPRAMATVALFSGRHHLGKRSIEEILEDLYGLTISLGTISNTEARVSDALVEPVEEAKEYIKEQAVVNMDETGHKMAGMKAWMWVAATSLVSVFVIRFSRATKVAKEVLGETFQGILGSDRWHAYTWINAIRRQLCWAHLIRDFTKISERSGLAGQIGTELVQQAKRMFHYWHRIRDGTITREQFKKIMAPIRTRIEGLLEDGATCGNAKTQRTCKRILKIKAALWTFVEKEGVEPTNNFAERLLRPFVLWRKMSFGTQSERGNLFVERMMTVSATCRLQERNVLDYLTTAIKAHLCGAPAPSLIPPVANIELPFAA